MRIAVTAVLLVTGTLLEVSSQAPIDPKLQGQLKRLFPDGDSVLAKGRRPASLQSVPERPAIRSSDVAGVGVLDHQLDPFERAYDGPIKILVGMDRNGVLAGVIVVEHHERRRPGFPGLFPCRTGKQLTDG